MSDQPKPKQPVDLSHRTAPRDRRPGYEIIAARQAVWPKLTAKNKFPEELFISGFLQFFAGYETHPDFNIGRWVSIAGTPFSEVDIIDQSGEVIYTVPPVYERHVIDPSAPRDVDMSHVAKTYEMLQNRSPAQAERYMDGALGVANHASRLDEFRGVGKTRMLEIFKRYDLTPAWAENEPNAQTEQVENKTYVPTVTDEEPL